MRSRLPWGRPAACAAVLRLVVRVADGLVALALAARLKGAVTTDGSGASAERTAFLTSMTGEALEVERDRDLASGLPRVPRAERERTGTRAASDERRLPRLLTTLLPVGLPVDLRGAMRLLPSGGTAGRPRPPQRWKRRFRARGVRVARSGSRRGALWRGRG